MEDTTSTVSYHIDTSSTGPGEVVKIDLMNVELWEDWETTCMFKIWNLLRPWFKSVGYHLYAQDYSTLLLLTPPEGHLLTDKPAHYPYPRGPSLDEESVDGSFETRTGVMAAVNANGRDVVIKIARADSEELAIFRMLNTEPLLSDSHNFTVPIVDILKYDDNYSFIVMPRWGDIAPPLPKAGFDTLETAFAFTEHMLKALEFLHRNLIAHRDLKPNNILFNYQVDIDVQDIRPMMARLGKEIRFVLCDFNISKVYSPDTSPSQRVVSSEEGECGTHEYHPPDVIDSCLETFDPFAFDVACLGGILCQLIGHTTPLVPALAPFLDRLVTPDIPSRYTAAEALDMFLSIKSSLDPDFLISASLPAPLGWGKSWRNVDRWAGLSEDFIRQCSLLHEPIRPEGITSS